MALNSIIGALRVNLGLDSAQFQTGLKKAEAGVAGFGASTKLAFAAVAAAAVAAGAALSVAVKHSIDHADALNKSAQKAGVTVEALSRLEYAAKLSDVSLEGLTSGLGKLGRAMVDASQNGKGDAARAFAALGIAIKDANGNIRSSDSVLKDVADRFSRFEDGATKTALAVALFGKSGAELIPLLNGGAAAIKAAADESDRFGNTVSTKTAKAAEEFNDNLTRLGASLQGLVNQALPPLLPLLDGVTSALADMDPQTSAVAIGIVAVSTAAIAATPAITALTASMKGLYATLALIAALPAGVVALATGAYLGSTTAVGAGEDALIKKLGLTRVPNGSAWGGGWGSGGLTSGNAITVRGGNPAPKFNPSSFTSAAAAVPKALEPMDLGLETTTDKVETLADKIEGPLTSAIQGFAHAVMQGTNPLKAFGDQLANIGGQFLDAGIQMLVKAVLGGVTGGFGFGGGYIPSFGAPGFAGGTLSAPPGMAWVGEQGPELVKFRGGEQVFDTARSAKMSAGGGDTYIVNADSFSRGADLANTIRSIVRQELPASVTRQTTHPHRKG